MTHSGYRVFFQHPRAAVAHDPPNAFTHFRFVAVVAAFFTRCFCFHRAAALRAQYGVGIKFRAFRTDRFATAGVFGATGNIVMIRTVQRDHLRNGSHFAGATLCCLW